jgi:hypothetical protein
VIGLGEKHKALAALCAAKAEGRKITPLTAGGHSGESGLVERRRLRIGNLGERSIRDVLGGDGERAPELAWLANRVEHT